MTTLKKLWSIVSTILVIAVVLCAVFLMGSRIVGFRVYTIISGSMEPQYSVGDLVYVRQAAMEDIQIGDDITFILNEELVVATHRVVRIDAEKKHFYTKGLANEIEDGDPVHYNNIIGKVQFSIPLLGYVADFIQNPPGTYIAIAAGAVLIILVFLPDFLPKKKEEVLPSEEELAAKDENARLKEELEALKAQLKAEQ